MRDSIEMNPNPLVQYLNKYPQDFTKADLIKYIEDNNVEMVNFRYVGWDMRLKTLNFIINDRQHLDAILTAGERVDGSSLFSFMEAGSSDLYVIPRYSTAFLNPFTEVPTVDILCSYYTKDGVPFESSPEYVLRKAHETLIEKTGYSFEVMGELEYYVISDKEDLFQAEDQKGYHESYPFAKWGGFRENAMKAIAQCGGYIKYGHAEVGNFTLGDKIYEQNEIEFLPTKLEEAADQLIIAKWILRSMANQYGVDLTFAPKITTGKAGSGLHIHTKLVKDGKTAMVKDGGGLSDVAKKAIAGYLTLAPSLTAFGNTNPTSYFRLVPHQEAPTNICWGDRNRSVLVRVPLGWSGKNNMIKHANPQEPDIEFDFSNKQTVEFRCPDGSADIHLLLAGLAVAVRHGLEMENALEVAKSTYVDVNIFNEDYKDKLDQLAKLPTSCYESALQLEKQADIYTKDGVFTQNTIDWMAKYLKSFNDQNLRAELGKDEEKIMEVVDKYFYCG